MFTRKQILDAANKYYPDSYMENYFDNAGYQKQGYGDKLADFIVSEISEVCDDPSDIITYLNDIRDKMESALDDISLVLDGIKELHNQIPGHETCWDDEEDEENDVTLSFGEEED